MKFKKYPSLINHYKQKEIGYWLNKYPELKDIRFSISEKLHGSSFGIWITQDDIQFSKRTSFLKEEDSFFNYQEIMKKYEKEINKIQNYITVNSYSSIVLYGEIFGGNIQKGVNYGIEKRFLIFDIVLNGKLLSQQDMLFLMNILGLSNMLVPQLGTVVGLFNALEYKSEFNSLILNKDDNICEGVVIKPYYRIYVDDNGSVFYIKNKNEKFIEKSRESKNKSVTPISTELLKLQSEFELYINENRLNCVISKYGEIDSEKQIGEYIRYFMQDAKKDFNSDYEDILKEIDNKNIKLIYKKGNKLCVNLIKGRL